MTMTESRQVRRARERRKAKTDLKTYPLQAQGGGPTTMLIHKNRRHRDDGNDYFKSVR
jgi:hypothetical protein